MPPSNADNAHLARLTPVEPINLSYFAEEFFRRASRHSVQEYVSHFGERLVAIYVRGSVHRNEAVPGVSDLDMHAVIADAPLETDQEWWLQDQGGLEQEFGSGCGVGRPIAMAEPFGPPPPLGAKRQEFYEPGTEVRAFQPHMLSNLLIELRCNATLVWGRDPTEGREIPPPDLPWAKEWLQGLRDYVRDVAGLPNEGRFDPDPLPEQPSLRLRTLARHAVLGGAYLLAGLGEYRSFRGADVIPALGRLFPQWSAFLEQTSRLYIHLADPSEEDVAAYLARLLESVNWIAAQLDIEP